MLNWYVFQSKTRKERFLCEQLYLRNIETFFPCIRRQPTKSHTQKLLPYFPGYVFGRVDLDAVGRSAVEWLPGAIRLVNFGGDPVPVQDHLVQTLRQHVDKINRSFIDRSKTFQPGEMVSIQDGPFAGYEGIFNTQLPGRERAEVLLRMLEGSQLRIELSIEHIAPIKTQSLSSY